jgi:peptidoglycan hydrolase-like protein with peptidoglycan-binding domain
MRYLLLLVFLVAPLTVLAEVRDITFPVAGTFSFQNDYGDPRDNGARSHQGIDIIAAKMTPVVATVDGNITFIAIPQASWGYSITIRDSEGYSYRYLHLNNDTPGTDDGVGGEANAYAAGLVRGSSVSRGQVIGWVGDSGNAESTVSHLHFEMRAPSGTINPYDSLFAAAGGNGTGTFVTPVIQGDEGSVELEEQFTVTRQLQEGMLDRDVAGLHQELTTLGYYHGEIQELYTPETREAVRAFQAAKNLTPSGIADGQTRRAIVTALKTGYVVPSVGTQSLELREGSTGERVTTLQSRLKELGFFSGTPTGYFGPATKASVIAFQTSRGIDPIGVVGPKTRAALEVGSVSVVVPTPTPGTFVFSKTLEFGMRSEDVRQLQLILIQEKLLVSEATGYFGSLTRDAVVQFQKTHNVDPIGIVGPKTRAVLNTL